MFMQADSQSNFLFILLGFTFLITIQLATANAQTAIDQSQEENRCESAELDYAMENGRILDTCYEKDTVTLTIEIEADSDDQLIIDLPKRLVYSFEDVDCKEGQMIILMDGEVIEPTVVSSKTSNRITIDVQKDTHQIEFIGTTPVPNPSPAMYCGIVMGYDTQYLPPKLQLGLGVEPEQIRCNQGLELAIKTSDENPICITPSTKSKLIERDLIKEKTVTTSNENNSESSTLIFGSEGTGDGQFIYPVDMEIDNSDNVYVVDYTGHRVQKFSPGGAYQSQLGSEGSGPGEFSYPYGIAIDSSNNVYVVDSSNHRIQKFDSDGEYILQFGPKNPDLGEFNLVGIAIDSSDNVYVVDDSNNSIYKFDSDGEYILQFGSEGSGPGEFSYPFGIAIDISDNVYVTDIDNHRIQKFDSSGNYISEFGSEDSDPDEFSPGSMVIDSSDNIYVVDSGNRILKFDSEGRLISQLDSDPNKFRLGGIAIDSSDNIYAVNTFDNTIQKFDNSDFE